MAINIGREKSSPFAFTRIIGFITRKRRLHPLKLIKGQHRSERGAFGCTNHRLLPI